MLLLPCKDSSIKYAILPVMLSLHGFRKIGSLLFYKDGNLGYHSNSRKPSKIPCFLYRTYTTLMVNTAINTGTIRLTIFAELSAIFAEFKGISLQTVTNTASTVTFLKSIEISVDLGNPCAPIRWTYRSTDALGILAGFLTQILLIVKGVGIKLALTDNVVRFGISELSVLRF